METAIHSDVLKAFGDLKQRPEIKHKESEADQIALLAKDEGFGALQKVIDKQIENLEQMKMGVPESLEAVGFRFLACQIAAEQLRYIKDLPLSLAKGSRGRKGL